MSYADKIFIDNDNLQDIDLIIPPRDQAREAVVGCETWVADTNHRGEPMTMTLWPNGRGAINFGGGDSHWGDFVDGGLVLDDDGTLIRHDGSAVYKH